MFLPPSCAQPDVIVNRVFNFTNEERSEDCLYLNIWSPAKSQCLIMYTIGLLVTTKQLFRNLLSCGSGQIALVLIHELFAYDIKLCRFHELVHISHRTFTEISFPPDNTPDEGPKTVMVYLYGGAFFFGSTNYRFYDGAMLAALTDVVVVSVNYRLGPLGFMNARIPEIPGNQGLWDQHLAFRYSF